MHVNDKSTPRERPSTVGAVLPGILCQAEIFRLRTMQARLQFLEEERPRRRGYGMDAGDADGADALLSLAALANDAMGFPTGVCLPEAATRELEAKLEAATAAAEAAQADGNAKDRPKRQRREPLRADVRGPWPVHAHSPALHGPLHISLTAKAASASTHAQPN